MFGFLFYQRFYNNVKKSLEEKGNLLFEIECSKLASKEFAKFKDRFAKMTQEEKGEFPSAIKMWNLKEKERYMKVLLND